LDSVKKPYVRQQRLYEAKLFAHKAPLLIALDIELTERCNNNCIHCYINSPLNDFQLKNKELSTKGIQDVLTEAALLGCLMVRFTGGEPLLRDDFEEIYIHARKLGMQVMLFTNGTLITGKIAALFCQIPPLEKIEITLYGMTKETYESITRIKGSFNAAMRGINTLLRYKIPFVVKWVHLPQNKKEYPEFEAWAKKLPWMANDPSGTAILDLRARRDSESKNQTISKLRMLPEEVLATFSKTGDSHFKEMREFCKKFLTKPGAPLFTCGAGKGKACMDAYGNLQMCMQLRQPDTVYDLRNGTLKDALSRFFPEIRKISSQSSLFQNRCAKCFLRGLCEQCPAKSWMEHGTLDSPVEYLCDIAHAHARFLGLLKKNEKAWEIVDFQKRIHNFTKNR